MQLCWSPSQRHVSDSPNYTAPGPGLGAALATEVIWFNDAAFQSGLVLVEVLTRHGHTVVLQQAKCVEIWGREGRLGHVEVFLRDG